jgi:hypothetical protein
VRRLQAILAIVALLAVPLALFARGEACQRTECPCCAAHASQNHGKRMSCSQCSGQGKCGMSTPAAPDYGLNAPMAPTAPESLATLPEPDAARYNVLYRAQSIAPGFTSAPFNPPRS